MRVWGENEQPHMARCREDLLKKDAEMNVKVVTENEVMAYKSLFRKFGNKSKEKNKMVIKRTF